jgi:hypothetical protein
LLSWRHGSPWRCETASRMTRVRAG